MQNAKIMNLRGLNIMIGEKLLSSLIANNKDIIYLPVGLGTWEGYFYLASYKIHFIGVHDRLVILNLLQN